MNCPLCGFEFEVDAMSCHSSCMFNESCGIICCPNCGYQLPDERKSRLVELFQRLLSRRQRVHEGDGPRPLSSMNKGESGKVVAIKSEKHTRVERLNVLGLTQEANITLEQKRPTYVVRVGFTELSVDNEIADEILVEVTG